MGPLQLAFSNGSRLSHSHHDSINFESQVHLTNKLILFCLSKFRNKLQLPTADPAPVQNCEPAQVRGANSSPEVKAVMKDP